MAAHDDKDAGKRARKEQAFAREVSLRIDTAITHISGTREGREFLWWLMQQGRVGSQPYSANALNTAFACGELNVGNAILARLISVDPAIYVRMQQEQLNDYRAALGPDHPTSDDSAPGEPGAYDSPGTDD